MGIRELFSQPLIGTGTRRGDVPVQPSADVQGVDGQPLGYADDHQSRGMVELFAAMLQAAEDDDPDAVDALAELGSDPDGLAELLADLDTPSPSRYGRSVWPIMYGWRHDPTQRSKTRITNDDGRHKYGKEAERIMNAQQRGDDPDREKPASKAKRLGQEREAARVPVREKLERALKNPEAITPADLGELADGIKLLKRDEIRERLRELKQKVGGKLKQHGVDGLLEHVDRMQDANRKEREATIGFPDAAYWAKDINDPFAQKIKNDPTAAKIHGQIYKALQPHRDATRAFLDAGYEKDDAYRELTNAVDDVPEYPGLKPDDPARHKEWQRTMDERKAAIAEIAEIENKVNNLTAKWKEAAKELGKANAAARGAIMEALKPERPGKVVSTDNVTNDDMDGMPSKFVPIPYKLPTLNKVFDTASDFVQSVTNDLGDMPVLFGVSATGRAWALKADGRQTKHTATVGIQFGDTYDDERDTKTAVHELGHVIEYHKPGVKEAAFAFLDYRCSNEHFTNLNKFGNYEDWEIGRKDKFDRAFDDRESSAYYVGKDYGTRATEIVSMGAEKFYQDPVSFVEADPEYRTGF